jgi:anaerobic selenocysteine-containing dehydrogenase
MVSETRRSTCNRDCPDACGLLAEVEDNRIVSLKGDPEHPVTRGFLCFRTSRFPALLSAPHRLRRPLLRRGGALVEVELDEALDIAAERLTRIRAESGPAAILHYRSGGSLGLLKLVADRFFEQFGPCSGKVGDICSGAGEAAQIADLGVSDSNDLFDLLHARHILLWGKNPTISNTHLVPVLKQARAAGCRISLIDPVRHRGAALADRFVQPRPGGDLALALGIARLLFEGGAIDPRAGERCDGLEAFRGLAFAQTVPAWAAAAGVEVAAVEALAAQLADGPTAILVGWGMQRRFQGGAIVRALDALSAISGNLFRSGGGCSFYFRRRGAFASDAVASGAAVRWLREPMLGADLLAAEDPPIRAVWITAGNPVCMLPDSARVAEALERTEFVVVVDPFLTDTGRRADLVLPVPTLLEDSDLLGSYGHHWLGESRPLVEPPPGVVHEVELFQRLAARVGLADAMAGSVDDWKRRLLARVAPQGASLDALRAGPVRNPEAPQVLFAEGRVRTPNGKVQLLDALPLDPARPDPASDEFPLWLFSNSTAESQAAQWARDPGERLPVTVHPDAAPPGLADGDPVLVESPQGSVPALLRLDPGQRTDLAILPKGGSFDRGLSANALIAAVPTDLGLGACYLDCRVRLRAP